MASIPSIVPGSNVGVLVVALCLFWMWIYNRRASKLRNIPGPSSSSFLTGNLFDLVAPTTGRDWVINVSKSYGGAAKLGGLLGGRSLLVTDPKALHHVLVKDQDNFEEWEAWTATNALLYGPGLLSTAGSQHKKQRRMLTPAFSIKNLRGMTPMFVSIARELETQISSMVTHGPREIDITPWLSSVALEVIGRGGMGVSFGKMTEPSPFTIATKQLAAILTALLPMSALIPFLKYLGPGQFRRHLIKLLPFSLLKRLEVIVKVMEDQGNEILAKQKQDLDNEVEESDVKDIINILLRANRSSVESERMSDDELTGQILTLVFAAMDTTSAAIARVLHQLAIHPEVQEKLRTEVIEAYNNQDEAIDFNNVAALPYLNAIIKETLRVFPPLPVAFRQTLKDTVLPLLHPITGEDGTVINEVLVEKGTDVLVNVVGSNHHPKTWGDDASEWKPERWFSEFPESVTKIREYSGVFAHQLTFLAGNRSCIGLNFAQLEMRVVLALFLQSFEFSLPKDTEIAWNLGLLMIPVIKGSDSLESQLPLIIKKREVGLGAK